MSTLVTFFSAEGTTKAVAEEFAKKIGADCFEIVPTELYTKADINYLNPLSRCNKEQVGKKDVPVKGKVEDFDKYDVIYIGFPIWYAAAPRVVYTFCKDYNWGARRFMPLQPQAEAESVRQPRNSESISKALRYWMPSLYITQMK